MKGLEGQQLGSDGLVFLVNSENSSKVAAAQRIVDQLSGAGVSISLERLSWTEYLAALERGDFDLYLAEVRLTADFDLTQLVGTRGGLNYGGWSDPATDGLLSAFRAAGAELRSSAAASLCSHLIQNAPIVPICFKNGSVLTQWGRLSGLDPVPGTTCPWLENWVLDPLTARSSVGGPPPFPSNYHKGFPCAPPLPRGRDTQTDRNIKNNIYLEEWT